MKALIFTGPSLRAMAANLKCQSRRLTGLEEVNKHWRSSTFTFENGVAKFYGGGRRELVAEVKCPYTVGEERWVRETWALREDPGSARAWLLPAPAHAPRSATDTFLGHLPTPVYRADQPDDFSGPWRSPFFMPRWTSRWTVRITGAGLQHFEEMSESDARAEGVSVVPFRPDEGFPVCDGFMIGPNDEKSVLHPTALKAFSAGWDVMHPEPWARSKANPFVWWFSFEARRTSAREAA